MLSDPKLSDLCGCLVNCRLLVKTTDKINSDDELGGLKTDGPNPSKNKFQVGLFQPF